MPRCPNCFAALEDDSPKCPVCGYVEGSPARELHHLHPGMTLAERYLVGQVLGFGMVGVTYKAWDTKLNTVVAIKEFFPDRAVTRTPGTKEVRPTLSEHEKYARGLRNFLNEARCLTRFSSARHIVNVFDFFEENATAYIVMEYLEGVTLQESLKGDDLRPDRAVDLARMICSALSDVHTAGFVHGAVNADNIFLCSNGDMKLIDFATVRAIREERGPWIDIYDLGSMLLDLLDGAEIPEQLGDALMKATADDPAQGFSSAAAFAQALPEKKIEKPTVPKPPKQVNKKLIAIIATALVLVIAVVSIAVPVYNNFIYTHLPKAQIDVWFSLPEDEEQAQRKQQAFEIIKKAFENAYPKVTVRLVAKSALSYPLELQKQASMNRLPALFESSGIADIDVLSKIVAMEGTLSRLQKDTARQEEPLQCLFVTDEAYQQAFEARKRLPLGFRAPVFYVNASLLQNALLKDGPVSDAVSLAGLLYENTGKFTYVSAERTTKAAFMYLFGNVNAQAIPPDPQGRELFLQGEAAAFFSDTADFPAIKTMKNVRLYPVGLSDSSDKKIPATFCDYWSIGKCTAKQLRCAEAFLCYLLSEYAQSNLYLFRSDAFPLNEDTFRKFQQIQGNAWQGFFGLNNQYLNHYAFSPSAED